MAGLLSRTRAMLVAAFAIALAPLAFADGPGDAGPDIAAPPVRAAPVTQSPAPQGQSGQVSLMDGAINLTIPASYRFYSSEQAYAFLQRNNAAAPNGTVLGLIAPANVNITQPGAWASVVSYQDIGYVSATTATGLTDTNFEGDVRAARQTQGRTFEGFAAQPAFDEPAAALAWGERAAAPGSGGKDLRYEQKKLGRRGVATLTSIGSADQMSAILAAAPDLMGMLNFSEGQRYADFQAGADTVSAYTVPALVTGVAPAAPQTAMATTEETQTGFGGLAGYFPWIALGVVVLAGAGYMLTRRRGDPNLQPNE